ncbi:MAG: MFS transporter [Pseudomonadota bacterium]
MLRKKRDGRLFYGYIVAVAGFLTWFFGWGVYAICFGVFFKPLITEFGWSRADISLGYSISLIIQATLGIVMGRLTDRLGPRTIVTVFGSFLGWSLLLTSQVRSLWQFYIFYSLIGGIGASILNIPIMATVSRWFIKRRGLMTGIVQAGAGFGGFFLAPFAGWLILSHGWRQACVVLGLITAAFMILSGLFLIRDPKDIGQLPDGDRAGRSGDIPARPQKKPAEPFSFRVLIGSMPFWLITGVYASFGYCRSVFTAHTAPHVQDLGFSLTDAAHVLAVISIASMVGRIGMGRVADRIGNRRTLIVSFAAIAAVVAWVIVTRSLWGLYVFAAVYGFCWGALAVLRFSVTAEVFGLGSVGFIMGILGFSESIAATFSSYFSGFIFDLFGSYNTAFVLCIAVSILGIILSWRLKPVTTDH